MVSAATKEEATAATAAMTSAVKKEDARKGTAGAVMMVVVSVINFKLFSSERS